MKVNRKLRYNKIMPHTNEIIGYQVKCINGGEFVHTDTAGHNFLSYREPLPIARGDAYRRLAAFFDQNDGNTEDLFEVVPVYRQLTPTETVAQELGSLLSSLCGRHGLQLGLSQAQIEAKIAQELGELGASPVVAQINRMR